MSNLVTTGFLPQKLGVWKLPDMRSQDLPLMRHGKSIAACPAMLCNQHASCEWITKTS